MVSCIERAIGCLSEIAHSTSAYNLLAGEALLLSASLQRIGMTSSNKVRPMVVCLSQVDRIFNNHQKNRLSILFVWVTNTSAIPLDFLYTLTNE